MNRYVFIRENDIIIWINYDKNIVGFEQDKSRVEIEGMGGIWVEYE